MCRLFHRKYSYSNTLSYGSIFCSVEFLCWQNIQPLTKKWCVMCNYHSDWYLELVILILMSATWSRCFFLNIDLFHVNANIHLFLFQNIFCLSTEGPAEHQHSRQLYCSVCSLPSCSVRWWGYFHDVAFSPEKITTSQVCILFVPNLFKISANKHTLVDNLNFSQYVIFYEWISFSYVSPY